MTDEEYKAAAHQVELEAEEMEELEIRGSTDGMGKLYAALANAQGQIAGAVKSADNPFFNSKYADLSAVWEACREPLSENGLAVIQIPIPAPSGLVGLVTILGHSDGASIKSTYYMPNEKGTAHGVGSALTYARRYVLSALVGVPAVDDDGNTASTSAFSSKQVKTKVWKALKDGAAENDDLKVKETWRELGTEEQKEIWCELSSGQRSTIKELLKDEAA